MSRIENQITVKMSNPQLRIVDAKISLPKKRNPIMDLDADAFKSKKFDVCIEDFLEKLNVDAGKVEDDENFIQSRVIAIGGNLAVSLDIYKVAESVWFGVQTFPGFQSKALDIIPRMLKVEGVCGNAPLKGEKVCDLPCNDSLAVELQKIEHLKEVMKTSGSPKLDLQVSLLYEESEWVITR